MTKKKATPAETPETPDATETPETVESIETPESIESKVGSVESIAESLIETAPDIQQHAIDNRQEQQQREEHAKSSGPVDRHGDSFDSTKHKSDASGAPILTGTGKLSLKSGRKAGAKSQSKIGSSAIGGTPNPDILKVQKARASGKGFANVVITMGQALGGDEWKPVKVDGYDERGNLEECFADYFEITGKEDLPPSMALAMGLAAYALPRFSMPVTQERAAGFGTKVALWWGDRKNKKLQAKLDRKEIEIENEKPEDS